MNNQALEQIVNWKQITEEPATFTACVRYTDQSEDVLLLTADEFTFLKERELRASIQQTEDQQCREIAVSICSWCKSIYNKSTGTRIERLSDHAYEQTTKDGSSHGICKACLDAQLATVRELKAAIKPEGRIRRFFKRVRGFLGLAIILVAVVVGSPNARPAVEHKVMYQISASSVDDSVFVEHLVSVTYCKPDGAIQQEDGEDGWESYNYVGRAGDFLSVSAQLQTRGSVTVRIYIDSVCVQKATSTGQYVIASARFIIPRSM